MPVANLHTQLASTDWLAPWWNPWRLVGQPVAARIVQGARVCDALNAELQAAGMQPRSPTLGRKPVTYPAPNMARTAPLHFVPQTALPEGVAYETYIFESGQVPTRENLHDFFNGLAWLVFPHTKRRLNALQYGELAAGGVQATRGALRDALTLFDENAAIWPCCANETATQLVEALRAKQWQRAFIDLRAQWQDSQPVLFGHALLEKLVTPYKSITAHVYIAQTTTETIALTDLDEATALQLSPASLAPKPFIPLPVLGVPLWWAANEDPGFYDDAKVFRAAREIAVEPPISAPNP